MRFHTCINTRWVIASPLKHPTPSLQSFRVFKASVVQCLPRAYIQKEIVTITSAFKSRAYSSSSSSSVQDSRPKDESIASLQVALISELGEKQGIFPLAQVLATMNRKDQVLIQVSEDDPPYCKIYAKKALYEKNKAEVKKKFKSSVSNKIIKAASNISPHDLQVKVNQCKKKLEKGDILKFILTVPRNTPPEKIESLVLPIYEDLFEKLGSLGKITEAFSVKEGSGSFTIRGEKKSE